MPETTYNKILDAAVAIFSERGYSGTSMREIAEALNVTKAALYYHFPGKAEIFSACLSRSLDQMVADLEKLAEGSSFPGKTGTNDRRDVQFLFRASPHFPAF